MSIPCVICGLGVDSYNPLETTNETEFSDGESLRKHLLDNHTKYVAEALLAPKMSNNAHFWLLANVDYSNKKEDGDTKECDENEKNNLFLLNLLLDSLDSKKNHNGNDLSLLNLNNNDSTSSNDAKNERSPTARLHELFNFNPLTTILENAIEKKNVVNENKEILASSFSRPEGLIESKAMRKTTCQVCQINICSTARQRHVYMIHLAQKDLFQCSKCDYTNSNSIWELRKHCVAQHGPEAVAISNEEKHRDAIMVWNQKCFPDWKQKKPSIWSKTENPIKIEDDNNLEMDIDNSTINNNIDMNSCVEDFLKQLQDLKDKNDLNSVEENDLLNLLSQNVPIENLNEDSNSMDFRETGDNEEIKLNDFSMSNISKIKVEQPSSSVSPLPVQPAPINDRICQMCCEESRYPGRHISQKHLKKSLYECPICNKFGSYECCTVIKHIQRVHPNESDNAVPISNLEKYADEIRELQLKCFPNRQMKLVRTQTTASRPRERHLCKICDKLIAQSDRQRHVYHRHLNKTRLFECPLCDFSSNYDVHRVKWHLKWHHREIDPQDLEPISHENEYRDEIDQLNETCFPGWQHRRKPFWWLSNENEQVEEEHDEQDNTSNSERNALTSSEIKNETNIEWTCQLCQKEFKPTTNLLRHVAKEHLNLPLFQCPICKGHGGHDAYDIRSHMCRIHGVTDMEPLRNVESNAEQIEKTYQQCFPGRKLKSIGVDKRLSTEIKTYDENRTQCQECKMDMKTEDRQIHVYRHHLKEPRLYECPLCDFAHHACSSDVKAHIRFAHREQAETLPKSNLIQFSKEINDWNYRCFPGWINRRLPISAIEDFNRCRLCLEEVKQTSRHIAEVHLKIPLHQCPLCQYGAAESRLVLRHMRNNHTKKEIKNLEPIANVVERRTEFSRLHDQCFPGRPKRLSNITISDGGRRTKCKKCSMTISKKRRVEHLLEKHLKKPIFKCKHCPFNSNFDKNAVEFHLANTHPNKSEKDISSNLSKHITQLKVLGKACFNDSNMKIL